MLIGLGIIALFVMAGSTIYFTTLTTYDVNPYTDDFNGSINQTGSYAIMDDLYADYAETGQSNLVGQEANPDEAEQSMFSAGFSTLKNMFNSLGILRAIIINIGEFFNAPAYVVTFFIFMFLVMMVFTILYLIMRFKS